MRDVLSAQRARNALAPFEDQQINVETPVVVVCPGYHGHEIARSLGRLGVPVYGVHADPRSPSARSRYWRATAHWNVATAPAEASRAWLLELAARVARQHGGQRPILLPTDDSSALLLADAAPTLAAAYRFPALPAGLTRALADKQAMYFLCRAHGIPAAETAFPTRRAEVAAFARAARYPVLLKGRDTLALRARTGVKMVLAHDAAELLAHYERLETPEAPSLMLQEFLPGGSRTVWMCNAYFNVESECLFGHTGKMIRQYPAYAGRTSLGVCQANPAVLEQTQRLMKAVGYSGPLDIGYKYDGRTGEYKTIDINPRIGATYRLFVDRSGLDVARALYLDLTGQPVVPGATPEGRKWVVENFDFISSPRYRRDEGLSLRRWLATYRGVEEGSWFALDDPLPFFAMGVRSLAYLRGGKTSSGLDSAPAPTPSTPPASEPAQPVHV
jgi:predicted ATP-grasp superfamily ATP-dependent carboligase